jgi:hypothetical protein
LRWGRKQSPGPARVIQAREKMPLPARFNSRQQK